MASGRFDGRVVIVTGAASGLGRASALQLGSEGATVAALDIAAEGAEKTAADIVAAGPGKAVALGCDVSDPASVSETVRDVVAELGPPRVLCNVAGLLKMEHTTKTSFEDWQRLLAVNLTGTFLMCQAAIPYLLENGGNIVNVASTAGLMGQPYSAAYCASKGGVVLLTKALAVEYVERGLRVNAVAPGMMDTPMILGGGFAMPDDVSRRLIARITSPMGSTTPEHVAKTIAFIASDDADYMSGAVVSIDGALTS